MSPEPMSPSSPGPGSSPAAPWWLPWVLPPLLLGATGLGVFIVLRQPDGLFGWVLALLVGAVVVWILASSIWPAKADRRCPKCGLETLERQDPMRLEGVVCTECGWSDETESSFLFAEDEGVPLEPIVLEERGAPARPPANVDTPAEAD